jgi:hypothetical protein
MTVCLSWLALRCGLREAQGEFDPCHNLWTDPYQDGGPGRKTENRGAEFP